LLSPIVNYPFLPRPSPVSPLNPSLPTRRVYAEHSPQRAHPALRKPLSAKPASAPPTCSARAIAASNREGQKGSGSGSSSSGGCGGGRGGVSTDTDAILEAPGKAESAAWDAYDTAFESVLASMWDDVRGAASEAGSEHRPSDGQRREEGAGTGRMSDGVGDAERRVNGSALDMRCRELGESSVGARMAETSHGHDAADESRATESSPSSDAACCDSLLLTSCDGECSATSLADDESCLGDEPLPLSTLPHGCQWALSHLPSPPALIPLPAPTPPPASPASRSSRATAATAASSPFSPDYFSESPALDMEQPLDRSPYLADAAGAADTPCSPPPWPSSGRLSPASSLLQLDNLIRTPTRRAGSSSPDHSEKLWDDQRYRYNELFRSSSDSGCGHSSSCSDTAGMGADQVKKIGALAFGGGSGLGYKEVPLLPESSAGSLGWLLPLPADTLDYMAQVQSSVQREWHAWLEDLGERTKGLREDMQEQFGRMREEMAVTFNVLEEDIQEMVDELEDEGILPDWTKLFDDDGGREEEWEELVSGRRSRRGGAEREEEERRRFLQQVMLAQRVYFDIHGEVVRRVHVREKGFGGGGVRTSRGPACIPVVTSRSMESAAVVF
ncbi:hypothetical protein CLOM_g5500, partial [Closterium sp. NIES-68]